MNAGLLFFAGILLGGLIGSLLMDYVYRTGQKKMMRDGDLYIRTGGKWYPRKPLVMDDEQRYIKDDSGNYWVEVKK